MPETKRRRNREPAHDLDALHRLLWLRAGDRHKLVIDVAALAGEACVTRPQMSRFLGMLVDRGRIRRVGPSGRHTLFAVTDPST